MASQAFFNGTVITDSGVIADGMVTAREGRIAYVGPRREEEVPPGAERIDAGGGYISPGFVDIHVHGGGGSDFMDATDADVVAWEPIWLDGSVVGWCTSGGYSHWTGKSVAQGFIPADRVQDGLELEVEILGERRPARVHLAALWDDGGRMRG